MKVFADTNVLISAFTSSGLCSELLESILSKHNLMTGEVVLIELDRVLKTKLKVPEEKVNNTIKFLRSLHVEPKPKQPSELVIRDEDDRWVLESAIQAGADILVTGDKDLLIMAEMVSSLKILSPRELRDFLQTI